MCAYTFGVHLRLVGLQSNYSLQAMHICDGMVQFDVVDDVMSNITS